MEKEKQQRIEILNENFRAKVEGMRGVEKVNFEKEHAAQLNKLNDEFARGRKDLEDVRDTIRGTFGVPADPDSGWAKASRFVRKVNLMVLGGGFGISSVPDIANILVANGLLRSFEGFFRSFAHGMDFMVSPDKAMKRGMSIEMHEANIATEMWGNNRALLMAGEDFRGKKTRMDRAMEFGARASMHASLLTPWNNYIKWVSGAVTSQGMMRSMRNLAQGKATRKEVEDLLWAGISQENAIKMHRLLKQHAGREGGGLINPNTLKWGSGAAEDFAEAQEMAKLWRIAWRRSVDNQIVTPSAATKPLTFNRELGKFVGQFKTFAFVATDRVLYTNMQRADINVLNGIILGTSLGMMVGYVKTIQAGKDPNVQFPTLPSLVIEGVDRSGLTGWFMEPLNIFEKVAGTGPRKWLGGPMGTRYASRNQAGTIWGPSLGQSQRFLSIAASPFRGINQTTIKNIRRMIPAQSSPLFQYLFNRAEDGINTSLGIPPASGRTRSETRR